MVQCRDGARHALVTFESNLRATIEATCMSETISSWEGGTAVQRCTPFCYYEVVGTDKSTPPDLSQCIEHIDSWSTNATAKTTC